MTTTMSCLFYALIVWTSIYTCLAIDFAKHYSVHDETHPLTPMPSQNAVECLTQLSHQLMECRNQSLKNWSVTDYSPLADVCCAQWDVFECDLDYVAKSKCTSEEMDEVNDYFDQLIDFYNEKTCHPFPRGSTHCVLPILAHATHERPPMPDPLAIDCLANIKPAVRFECYEESILKWNVSRKGTPIKNLCCATWDNIDCLDKVAQIRCPSQEVTVTEAYFKQLESWAGDLVCKNATYHSSNCTIKTNFNHRDMVKVAQLDDSYVPFVFPAKADKSAEQPNLQVDEDYRDFLMNYILTVFPHLLNLLVLLTVVLVAVIVIQCFLIGRQLKREQCFSTPIYRGYQKVNV